MKDIYDFYSKNLNKLDSEWKEFCFKVNKTLQEAGDSYYNERMFWDFVEARYMEIKND